MTPVQLTFWPRCHNLRTPKVFKLPRATPPFLCPSMDIISALIAAYLLRPPSFKGAAVIYMLPGLTWVNHYVAMAVEANLPSGQWIRERNARVKSSA